MTIKTIMKALALMLISSSVYAHPGDHGFAGVLHFFTEPDHLLMSLAVAGALVWGLSRRSKRAENRVSDKD
ncbi:HupE/UreJ family protein [Parendozoicomonas haliclonae]|uniref:HupE / UreJ protein n=1 Tax=Parendozoicomonas haliclonae TaxID=1960125 RepID=A0A1X7AHH7_9GAMM|nr:HupE/UreJ family protein [Parendozoicomonas haliclonae]SMA41651.1 hypothetical protein EHSB41UT_01293 [Parendozoicomonas haliclonae]